MKVWRPISRKALEQGLPEKGPWTYLRLFTKYKSYCLVWKKKSSHQITSSHNHILWWIVCSCYFCTSDLFHPSMHYPNSFSLHVHYSKAVTDPSCQVGRLSRDQFAPTINLESYSSFICMCWGCERKPYFAHRQGKNMQTPDWKEPSWPRPL